MIAQIFIGLFGATAIWLIGRKERWSRWGYVVGLAGQPFWVYSAYSSEQWGVLFLCVIYTYSWGQGVYNNWLK